MVVSAIRQSRRARLPVTPLCGDDGWKAGLNLGQPKDSTTLEVVPVVQRADYRTLEPELVIGQVRVLDHENVVVSVVHQDSHAQDSLQTQAGGCTSARS